MSEPNQPEERETVGVVVVRSYDGTSFPGGESISARIERDPAKLPDMRWIKRDGSYRLEVLYYNVWSEVPFWPNQEEKD